MPDALRSALYLELAISHGAAMNHIGQVNRELAKVEQQIHSIGSRPITGMSRDEGQKLETVRRGTVHIAGDYRDLAVSAEDAMRAIDQVSHGLKRGLFLRERMRFETDGYRRAVVRVNEALERMAAADFKNMPDVYQDRGRAIHRMAKSIDEATGHVKNFGLELLSHIPIVGRFFETARGGLGAVGRTGLAAFLGGLVKEGYQLAEMQDHFSKANFRGTMSIREWGDTIRLVRKDAFVSQRVAIEAADALSVHGLTAGKTSEEIAGMAADMAKASRIMGLDIQTVAGISMGYKQAGVSADQWGSRLNHLRKIQQFVQLDSKNMSAALQQSISDQDDLESAFGVGTDALDQYTKALISIPAMANNLPHGRSVEKEMKVIASALKRSTTMTMSEIESPFDAMLVKIRGSSNGDLTKNIEGIFKEFANPKYAKLMDVWDPKKYTAKQRTVLTGPDGIITNQFGKQNMELSRIAYNAMHAAGGMDAFIKQMKDAQSVTGDKTTTDEAHAATLDTLQGALEKLNATGAKMQESLEGPLNMLKGALGWIGDFVNNNPWLIKGAMWLTVAKMGTGLFSGLVGGGMRMIAGFRKGGALGGIKGLFGSIFGIGGGAAAAEGGKAVASTLKMAESGLVRTGASAVGGGAARMFGKLGGAFGKAAGFGMKFLKVAGPIGIAFDLLMNHGEGLHKMVDGLIDGVSKLANAALEAGAKVVSTVGTATSEVIGSVGHAIGGTLGAIGDAATGAGKALLGLGTRVARWGAGEADASEVIAALSNPTFVDGIKVLGSLKMDGINKEFESLGNAINRFRYVDKEALVNMQSFGNVFSNLFDSNVGQTLATMGNISATLPMVHQMVDLMGSIGDTRFADTMSIYSESMTGFSSVVKEASAALEVFESKRKDMDVNISQIVKGYGTVVSKIAEKNAEATKQAAALIVEKMEDVYQRESKERNGIKDILSEMKDGGESYSLGPMSASWRR